jgi:hypothetical protein
MARGCGLIKKPLLRTIQFRSMSHRPRPENGESLALTVLHPIHRVAFLHAGEGVSTFSVLFREKFI